MTTGSETKPSAVRDVLTREVIKAGFPVIAEFPFQDSSATIYAETENKISTDDYGSEFIERGSKSPCTLKDLTEEGLFRLYSEGIRPGHADWENSLADAKEFCYTGEGS